MGLQLHRHLMPTQPTSECIFSQVHLSIRLLYSAWHFIVCTGAKLAAITAGAPGQPIGWFMHRPGTPQHPSLREALVTASLQQWLAQQQQQQQTSSSHATSGSSSSRAAPSVGQSSPQLPPVVFGVIGSGEDHAGATITLQYRMFQAIAAPSPASSTDSTGTSRAGLQPLQLQTLNLGRSLGHHADAGSSSSSSMGFEGATFGAALDAAPPEEAQQLLRQLEAAAAAQQVGAIEGVYGALLRRLEGLATEVGGQMAEVDILRQQQEVLPAQLSA